MLFPRGEQIYVPVHVSGFCLCVWEISHSGLAETPAPLLRFSGFLRCLIAQHFFIFQRHMWILFASKFMNSASVLYLLKDLVFGSTEPCLACLLSGTNSAAAISTWFTYYASN